MCKRVNPGKQKAQAQIAQSDRTPLQNNILCFSRDSEN